MTTVANTAKEKHPVSAVPILRTLTGVRGVREVHHQRVAFELWLNSETEFT